MKLDFKELLYFYRQHTYGNLMSYWMKQVDSQHGGLLNCLSNRGDVLLHEHKFVWSQGRWAWTAARLYEDAKGEVPEDVRQSYLETAKATTRFLMKHSRLENGNCAFVLSREGKPIRLNEDGTAREKQGDEVYDYSMSADRFAYYGVAEYARVAGDQEAYDWAKDLRTSCEQRVKTGTARHDFPYPTPGNHKTHGGPMSAVEDCQEFARAADRFGDKEFAEALRTRAREAMSLIMETFVQGDGLIHEMMSDDYKSVDTLLGRYVNPGHTLEDMWFVLHQAMEAGDRDVIERVADVSLKTCEVAWDTEFGGGIPQFMDCEGGQPKGPLPAELEDHPMIWKIRNLWDKKLWWPHSEALYTLLLVYDQTGQDWALDWYQRFHEYTFKTFPQPDESIGEWIQIRDRAGEPEEAVVALPVKDPMHIVRAFQHAINALKRMVAKG